MTRIQPITRFSATLVALPIDNVDTDQIIPARFLKGTTRTGLGTSLFADWRYRTDGRPDPAFVLNQPAASEAGVLVAGANFGCGSSREHAAWALRGFGFRAVVSTAFADIFQSNALKNGLLPIAVAAEAHARLLRVAAREPLARVSIDVPAQTLTLPDGATAAFPLDPFAKHCLVHGVDPLGFLLEAQDEIAAFERLAGPAEPRFASSAPSPRSGAWTR